jgi:hypothetical protein
MGSSLYLEHALPRAKVRGNLLLQLLQLFTLHADAMNTTTQQETVQTPDHDI